jgi:hypothetical protein
MSDRNLTHDLQLPGAPRELLTGIETKAASLHADAVNAFELARIDMVQAYKVIQAAINQQPVPGPTSHKEQVDELIRNINRQASFVETFSAELHALSSSAHTLFPEAENSEVVNAISIKATDAATMLNRINWIPSTLISAFEIQASVGRFLPKPARSII